MASEEAKGPGSLRVHLLDNLANLTPADVSENVKIENA
jgi:hydroxyethylthiazole kinase-like sugar kinase family protein